MIADDYIVVQTCWLLLVMSSIAWGGQFDMAYPGFEPRPSGVGEGCPTNHAIQYFECLN